MDKIFLDKTTEPSEDMVRTSLGVVYKHYTELIKLTTGEYQFKWTFYKGWSLKVFSKKKALFYLVPCKDSFMLSMAIRESERDVMIQNDRLEYMKKSLEEADSYSEGLKVEFNVFDDESADRCVMFVKELIVLRG